MNIRSECWRQILVCWSLQDLRICLKKTSWVDQFYRYLVSCLSKGCISSPLIWCEFSKLVNVSDIIAALLEFWSNIDGSWWISITCNRENTDPVIITLLECMQPKVNMQELGELMFLWKKISKRQRVNLKKMEICLNVFTLKRAHLNCWLKMQLSLKKHGWVRLNQVCRYLMVCDDRFIDLS